MITQTEAAFAVTVRGYDRAQVDEYVDTLREWLDNATVRMEAAESERGRLTEQVMLLRTRITQLERQLNDTPPRSIAALGDRVGQILRLAEEGAVNVQADAEAEAVAILGKARQDAADVVGEAQARCAEMETFTADARRQAADTFDQAEARSAEAASRLLAEAETRAVEREADAVQRARALIVEAEGQRKHILAQLEKKEADLRVEVERLVSERDGVRDGLTRLRESLHRTVSELSDSAPPSRVATLVQGTVSTTGSYR
jgi:DivIVA domain-containing protein